MILKPGERMRLCIVDDRSDIRELLRLVLRHSNCEVSTIGTADEARTLFAETRPHLVLLDVLLPGGACGLDLCKELKQLADPPVVLMFSSHATGSAFGLSCEAQADGFLVKPVSPDRLQDIVERIRLWLSNRGPKPEDLWEISHRR